MAARHVVVRFLKVVPVFLVVALHSPLSFAEDPLFTLVEPKPGDRIIQGKIVPVVVQVRKDVSARELRGDVDRKPVVTFDMPPYVGEWDTSSCALGRHEVSVYLVSKDGTRWRSSETMTVQIVEGVLVEEHLSKEVKPVALGGEGAQKPTMAILTFTNTNKDPQLDWLGVGFAEALTTRLTALEGIRLVERMQLNQMLEEMKLAETGIVGDVSAAKLGKLLGAQYVSIGSVQVLGDPNKPEATLLGVNSRIVKVETSEILMSVATKGTLARVFDLEKELALSFVKGLGYKATEEETQALEEAEVNNVAAYRCLNLGRLHYDNKEYAKAAEQLEKAAQADPTSLEVKYGLGLAYAQMGRIPEAIAQAKAVLDAAKDDRKLRAKGREMLLQSAQICAENKQCAQAIDLFHALVALAPEGLEEKGETPFGLALKSAESEKEACKALRWVATEAAGTYRKNHCPDEAIVAWLTVLSLSPEDGLTMYNIGNVYLCEKGDDHAALRWYERARVIRPNDFDLLGEVATVYRVLGETDKALSLLTASGSVGKNLICTRALVDCLIGRSEYQKAINLCEEMLPKRADREWQMSFLYRLGGLYNSSGEKGEVLQVVQRAEALVGQDASYMRTLGDLLKDLGEIDKAIHWYEKALESGVLGQYSVYYGLGQCYEQTKNYTKAIEHYERVIELAPKSAMAAEAAEKLKKLRGAQ